MPIADLFASMVAMAEIDIAGVVVAAVAEAVMVVLVSAHGLPTPQFNVFFCLFYNFPIFKN